jgi:nucleoid-associated protein YgaU
MADDQKLEQMKQKYASVLNTVQQERVQLTHVHIQDGKFFIQGTAPSEQAKNKVWDQIKLVNPNWSQELVADIGVDQSAAPQQPAPSAQAQQQRAYTVKPGDSLSKIAKEFYGNANDYNKIFEANRDILKDPNKISPGQTLKIPA